MWNSDSRSQETVSHLLSECQSIHEISLFSDAGHKWNFFDIFLFTL